jgi:collagenase-like PrtC family protease
MNFSVGFRLRDEHEKPFSEIVSEYRDKVSEIFFSWRDIPNGRSNVLSVNGFADPETEKKTERELRLIKDMGVKLDLLFNGNCYGDEAISNKLSDTVRSTVEHLQCVGGVDIITTTSPAIAHVMRTYFPNIEVRASVNMRIGTVKGMEYMAELFDSFHVQRDYNRDLARLRELKAWADENEKKLIMLANSGCFAFCSGQTFHDNLVSHESGVCKMSNMEDFMPYVCWNMLKSRDNWPMLLQNTWVRPEDLHNYEGLFDTVKLATRMHERPELVIGAYARGYHVGNTLDLFEPGQGRAIRPYIIDNTAFPKDWFEKTTGCDKSCHKCNYCKSVLEKVLLNIEEY